MVSTDGSERVRVIPARPPPGQCRERRTVLGLRLMQARALLPGAAPARQRQDRPRQRFRLTALQLGNRFRRRPICRANGASAGSATVFRDPSASDGSVKCARAAFRGRRDNTLTTSTSPNTSMSSTLPDKNAANGRIGHKVHPCRTVEGLVTRIGRGFECSRAHLESPANAGAFRLCQLAPRRPNYLA